MEIVPVVTSRFRLDGGSMFGVIPKALWEPEAPADELNRIELAVNSLVVRTGEKAVLVEPGMGMKYDGKRRDIYALETLDAAEAVSEAGVNPSDVDLVVPTHLHLDHAGGLTYRDGSGALTVAFPRAGLVVQEAEWEAAISPGPLEKASYNPDDYVPLERQGLLRIVSGDVEVLPGVRVELTAGHTRGHQVVRMGEGGEEALFLGDIVPTTAHLELRWLMAWDIEPRVVYEHKRRLLEDAARRGVICFFPHDPKIAGCRLEARGRSGFRVLPDTVIEAV